MIFTVAASPAIMCRISKKAAHTQKRGRIGFEREDGVWLGVARWCSAAGLARSWHAARRVRVRLFTN